MQNENISAERIETGRLLAVGSYPYYCRTYLSSITYRSIDRERSRDSVKNGYNSTRLRPLKDGFHNVEISPRDRTAVLN